MGAKILVVDDSRHMRDFFTDSVLRPAGYTVLTAPEGQAGLRLAREHHPDLIVADLQMPGLTGLQLKRELTRQGDTTPVILVTAEGSEQVASEATLAGISYYLPKPVDVEVMLAAIEQALTVERLRRERAEAVAALEKRVNQLETLQHIGRALTSLGDLERALLIVVEGALRLTEADAAALFLLEERGGQLQQRAARAPGEARAAAGRAPAADPLALHVARTGQALAHRPAPNAPPGLPPYPALAVPLRVNEHLLGVVVVDTRAGHKALPDSDLGPLTTLADTAAVAIANTRLFLELQVQSVTDGLTGLFNRRHTFVLAEREFQRARRFGRSLSALMFDIDHFKLVNDIYGHAAGDQVLAEVANRIRIGTRSIDIPGRYGGEEFVLLLPETELPGAVLLAERLRRRIAGQPITTVGGRLEVTVSLGVATSSAEVPDVNALVNQADANLYLAKKAGRNRVVPEPPRERA
ncbi:MAG: diguanylate cyclase [Anaerolineales bacterium]|nr:diguanylate cyclase [Anaerolineales bacterium]